MRRMSAGAVAAALSVVALAGCGGSSSTNKFPAAARSAFISSCSQHTPASACTCMFNYIQAHVSLARYKAAVAQVDANQAPKFVLAAALSCRKSAGSSSGGTTT